MFSGHALSGKLESQRPHVSGSFPADRLAVLALHHSVVRAYRPHPVGGVDPCVADDPLALVAWNVLALCFHAFGPIHPGRFHGTWIGRQQGFACLRLVLLRSHHSVGPDVIDDAVGAHHRNARSNRDTNSSHLKFLRRPSSQPIARIQDA